MGESKQNHEALIRYVLNSQRKIHTCWETSKLQDNDVNMHLEKKELVNRKKTPWKASTECSQNVGWGLRKSQLWRRERGHAVPASRSSSRWWVPLWHHHRSSVWWEEDSRPSASQLGPDSSSRPLVETAGHANSPLIIWTSIRKLILNQVQLRRQEVKLWKCLLNVQTKQLNTFFGRSLLLLFLCSQK